MASFIKSTFFGLLVASAAAAPAQTRPSALQQRSSSSKRGAAYNDASLVSILSAGTGSISWAYNWGSESDGTIPSGVEYVPMLWGTDSIDGWSSAVTKALNSGSTHLMGFNEPDSSSQANMSPTDAATYYKENITPHADDATLVSPAVTSSESSGEGLDWMDSFLNDCEDCKISVLAIHWYGTTFSELKSFVQEAITTASNHGIDEVWLTEFGLSSDEGGILDLAAAVIFVNEANAWLEEQSEVTRYAYFYCANDYMLTDSVVNIVGDAYVAAGGSSSSSTTSSSSVFTTSTSSVAEMTFFSSTSESTIIPTTTSIAWSETTTSEPAPVPTTSTTPTIAPPAPTTTSKTPVYSLATSTSTPAVSPSHSATPIVSPSPTPSYTPTPSFSTRVTPTTTPPAGDDAWENGACSQVVKQVVYTTVIPV